MKAKFYTGVGSRETPPHILDIMTRVARALGAQGWTLRSGHARGADKAFEAGAPVGKRKIYVPNTTFEYPQNADCVTPKETFGLIPWLKAMEMACDHHPAGRNLSHDHRQLHGRNVFQLLGDDLKTPSSFLLCWAPLPRFDEEGRVVDVDGGTGTTVRMAATFKVPVYHLGIPEHLNKIEAFLEKSAPNPTARSPRP